VVLAENGQQALDILALDMRFDGILMDCQMPVMDGYVATREIRGALASHVAVVAMTANASAADRKSCLKAGMDDFISKPFTEADLVAVVVACRERGLIPSS